MYRTHTYIRVLKTEKLKKQTNKQKSHQSHTNICLPLVTNLPLENLIFWVECLQMSSESIFTTGKYVLKVLFVHLGFGDDIHLEIQVPPPP